MIAIIVSDKIKKWSIAGFFVILVLGSLFHFVFDWSNHNYLLGAFFPVNESVWEHLKLGLWTVIIFSVFEYHALSKSVNSYFFAKATGMLIISFTILLIYYSYSYFSVHNILWLDILSYVIGVMLCQIFCFRIFQSAHFKWLNIFGIILLIFMCTIVAAFTYFPPHHEIFKDHRNGQYGLGIKAMPDSVEQ